MPSFVPMLLCLFAIVGLLAAISPNRFRAISQQGNKWIDSQKLLSVLDKRVDIDQLFLPHLRLLGVLVLLAVGVLAYFYSLWPG